MNLKLILRKTESKLSEINAEKKYIFLTGATFVSFLVYTKIIFRLVLTNEEKIFIFTS